MDGDRENAYYVTVSAGIFVMCRDEKISTEDALSRADERLYEATEETESGDSESSKEV